MAVQENLNFAELLDRDGKSQDEIRVQAFGNSEQKTQGESISNPQKTEETGGITLGVKRVLEKISVRRRKNKKNEQLSFEQLKKVSTALGVVESLEQTVTPSGANGIEVGEEAKTEEKTSFEVVEKIEQKEAQEESIEVGIDDLKVDSPPEVSEPILDGDAEVSKRKLPVELQDFITGLPVNVHPVLRGRYYYLFPPEVKIPTKKISPITITKLKMLGKKCRVLPDTSILDPESTVRVGIISGIIKDYPMAFDKPRRFKHIQTHKPVMSIGPGNKPGTSRIELYDQILDVAATRVWRQVEQFSQVNLRECVLEYLEKHYGLMPGTNLNSSPKLNGRKREMGDRAAKEIGAEENTEKKHKSTTRKYEGSDLY